MNHEYTLRQPEPAAAPRPAKRVRHTVIQTPCPRCGGGGYFPQYKHVDGGRCFRCNGTGFIERLVMR